MQTKKRNSFRCFAIYQIGMGGEQGKFVLIHQRGCKKTFMNQKAALIDEINKHFDGQDAKTVQQKDEFQYDNWVGIKDQSLQDVHYWLFLCHSNANKAKVRESLMTFKIMNQKNYINIDPSELDDKINHLEQKYSFEPDGFASEEDQTEIDRNMKIQKQQEQFYQQQQQQQSSQYQQQQKQSSQYQQQQQQSSSQYQQQQKSQQQQQQQSSSQYQQQQQYQTPQKISQHKQTSTERSPTPINKRTNIDYSKINSIIKSSENLKPNIQVSGITKFPIGLIASDQQKNIQINSINPQQGDLLKSEKQKIPRKKEQFFASKVKVQMEESNQLKQADALIRNSILGALAGSAIALIV